MDWKTTKLLLHLLLCFYLVNSQLPTTTDLPGDEGNAEPEGEIQLESESEPDAATIERFNLNVGAANVDYGPLAFHKKYIPIASDFDFSYDDNDPRGPSNWAKQWPMCSGAEQSPINFQVDLCTVQTAAVPLQYFNSGRRPRNVTIENNGYSIEYLFHFEQTPVLYGGPLTEGYVFEFIHFHWGGNDSEGSEHHLNGRKYEVEMHAGHRNAKYRDLREAAQFNDGIAVLGFLFQVSEYAPDNSVFAVIEQLTAVNSTVQLQNTRGFTVRRFMGNLAEEFVNARGSLTTPPCAPANWLLATRVRNISRNDLNRFRSTEERPTNHFRPIHQRQNMTCSVY